MGIAGLPPPGGEAFPRWTAIPQWLVERVAAGVSAMYLSHRLEELFGETSWAKSKHGITLASHNAEANDLFLDVRFLRSSHATQPFEVGYTRLTTVVSNQSLGMHIQLSHLANQSGT